MRQLERILLLSVVGLALLASLLYGGDVAAAGGGHAGGAEANFPPSLQSYQDTDLSVSQKLASRIKAHPFNLVGSLIFLAALVHTFLAGRITAYSHKLEHEHEERISRGELPPHSVSMTARLLHFFGEVEVVFGLWAVLLVGLIVVVFDWSTAVGYLSGSVNFTEAMFVVVIMTLAATRPVLKLAESLLRRVADSFGGSLTAWWLSILTLGPILGSLITEPAAMTISALLLVRKFYILEPGLRFKYATLGLLFVNISVGGTLTHFAAPPVLMVAQPWDWGFTHMLLNFGWKAVLGILVANAVYWLIFRSEFERLREKFEIGRLKEEILQKYVSRDEMEREIDAISSDIRSELGFSENLASMVDDLMEKLEARLEEKYVAKFDNANVPEELARKAFEERFEEVKLHRLQRELPHLLHKKDRAPFKDPKRDQREDSVPGWVILVHVLFLGWTIFNAHHPALFVAGLLFFLGFAVVTEEYQNTVDLKPSLLVGFFLGALVVHGGLQGWWIEPVLGSLSELPLMFSVTVLTAFNDNAALTYLSTLIPGFTDSLKYAVVSGAVAGGGLTVIANAPNPAGQALLKPYFPDGISPLGLFLGALLPTIILFGAFILLS